MEYKEWLEKERQCKAEETIKQELELLNELKEKYEPAENRFIDNGNGTVTDNLTGLIWLKNANAFDYQNWAQALASANALARGSHGLTDGSKTGDWRLPNVKELHNLIDFASYNPALPESHPFIGVQSSYYWSGTAYSNGSAYAWGVSLSDGSVGGNGKAGTGYVWPVRGCEK